MEKIILHVDLDYFFAQLEEKRHLGYKTKPLVVCVYSGRTKDSGAVSTSNYVARDYGVRSGVPIMHAKKLLAGTDALFVPADHEHYAELSNQIMYLIIGYAEAFEQASIDEAYLEITKSSHGDYEKAKKVAEKIKEAIKEQFGLTCSIGVAPNKLLAKIACDFKKPDGLMVVKPNEVQKFLDPMSVVKIPGIGKKSAEVLERIGVKTVKQLRMIDPGMLTEYFGRNAGSWLFRVSRGIDESGLEQKEQKQISRMRTLPKSTGEYDEITGQIRPILNELKEEIEQRKLSFSTVGVIAIDENLKMHTRTKSLQHPSSSFDELRYISFALFHDLCKELEADIRRIGIKVENLEDASTQRNLMDF